MKDDALQITILREELKERDTILTDARLDALTSRQQLEELRQQLHKLRSENSSLKEELVRELIMSAYAWDGELAKLPKKKDDRLFWLRFPSAEGISGMWRSL